MTCIAHRLRTAVVTWVLISHFNGVLLAAELFRVTEAVWDAVVPAGKEVDCIYGDLVLRNDEIVAVIAQPVPRRKANMTTRGAGGSVIDLTRRAAPNDQLTCYFPGAAAQELEPVHTDAASGEFSDRTLYQSAQQLEYRCQSHATEGQPHVTHQYRLADGDHGLTITTTYVNPHVEAIKFTLQDAIRADRSFDFAFQPDQNRFTACDLWWHQAYAIVATDHAPAAVGDTMENEGAGVSWTPAGQAGARRHCQPG